MTETVKDVFDTLLEAHRKIVQQAYGDGDYVFGTSQLDNYIDGWKDRFAKSVTVEKGSKSTPLTEKQKKCPYCHAAMGNKVVGKIVAYNDYSFCPMCGRRLEEK